MNSTLTATKVFVDQDLRRTHRMRDAASGIRRGQCWIYVNTARTMARIVGRNLRPHGGVMISVWAPDGEEIDVAMLQRLVSGFRLLISVSERDGARIEKEEYVERRRAA